MLLVKSKAPYFSSDGDIKITTVECNGWQYQFVRDAYKLISQDFEVVERSCTVKQIAPEAYIIYASFIPADLAKVKYPKGKPIKLCDGNEWYLRTITDVKFKLTLGDDFKHAILIDDPLFEYLKSLALNNEPLTIERQLDVISRVLSSQYYIDTNMILALELLNSDVMETAIETIFKVERDEEFFRASSDELQTR
ncbi:MAG: hypothetical protein QXS54_09085 [Candidatus Methanomethylicaceae archaeon]